MSAMMKFWTPTSNGSEKALHSEKRGVKRTITRCQPSGLRKDGACPIHRSKDPPRAQKTRPPSAMAACQQRGFVKDPA